MRPPDPTPTPTCVATAAPRTVLPFDVAGRVVPAAHDRSGSPLALAPTVVRFTTTEPAVDGTAPPTTVTDVPLTVTVRPATLLSHTLTGAMA